jgi:hypothetical protein
MPLQLFYIRLKHLLHLRFNLLLIFLSTFVSLICHTGDPLYASQSGKNSSASYSNDQPVYLYYFYFTPRCDECIILENALQKVLNSYYSQEIKSKKLIYKGINLTDPDTESRKIIQDLRVRRQLLLLVSGDTIINLTKDAFRYAESQHERFTEFITNAIDQVLSPQNAVIQNYKSDQQRTCMLSSAEAPVYSDK